MGDKNPASPSAGSVNLAEQAVFTVQLRLKKKKKRMEWNKVSQILRPTVMRLLLFRCPSKLPCAATSNARSKP